MDKKILNAYYEIPNMVGERLTSRFQNKLSEDIPESFIDAGQAYWIDVKGFVLKWNRMILAEKVKPYYVEDKFVDIDTEIDLREVKRIYEEN